jgi:hypothetical protein
MISFKLFYEEIDRGQFSSYTGSDFLDIQDKDLDKKYNSIEPNISIRDWNNLQVKELKEFIRSKMSVYKDISDKEMSIFISRLSKSHPDFFMKLRLRLAAKYPSLFDYKASL